MKKIVCILGICVLLTSCLPTVYKQVATVESDNVTMDEDGVFAYKDKDISVNYNFWAEDGLFIFDIVNHSDEDIYLDMSKSFFIHNLEAMDYYEGLVYHLQKSMGTSVLNNQFNFWLSNTLYNDASLSVERKEKDIVCIPSKSYKSFYKYNVLTEAYRECGFIRNPSKNEIAIVQFDWNSTPVQFENRLTFVIDGQERTLVNKFYIAECRNINERYMFRQEKSKDCSGNSTTVNVNEIESNDKFYITYNEMDIVDSVTGYKKTDRK